jgi:hypothetical protein
VGLRDRLKKLRKAAEREMVAIPQKDGTVKCFPESELAPAFLDAFECAVGRSDLDEPGHPLCAAARNSSDPAWRDSSYATGSEGRTEPVEDLSE